MSDALFTELRTKVRELIDAGVEVNADTLTAQYIAEQGEIVADNEDFWRVCAYAHTRTVARKAIGKYDESPERPDRQLVLPGFTHLQAAYSLNRDGRDVLVPVNKATDEELLARAALYDEMADGCRAHGREIRDFVTARADQLEPA